MKWIFFPFGNFTEHRFDLAPGAERSGPRERSSWAEAEPTLGRPVAVGFPAKHRASLGPVGSGSRGRVGQGASLLGGAEIPAWCPWGARRSRHPVTPRLRPTCSRALHQGTRCASVGGGRWGKCGAVQLLPRKQVCRAGLSGKSGASAMLIVITF